MSGSPQLRPDHAGVAPDDGRIGEALARLESALERKPGFGHATTRSTTDNAGGTGCVTAEGHHQILTDLPAALGGSASAPTPSTLLRAALGSCLAMSYRLRAARHGVELGAIRVCVETDSALAGMLLPGSTAPPGFLEIRYHVEIESSAPAARVEQITTEADRLSPVLDALRANRVCSSLSIVGAER
jgi:uncharacterized OsmC-like protein